MQILSTKYRIARTYSLTVGSKTKKFGVLTWESEVSTGERDFHVSIDVECFTDALQAGADIEIVEDTWAKALLEVFDSVLTTHPEHKGFAGRRHVTMHGKTTEIPEVFTLRLQERMDGVVEIARKALIE